MIDDEIPLFPLIVITLGVLFLVGLAYFVKANAKQLFIGFKGLQTQRRISKLLLWTGLERAINRQKSPVLLRKGNSYGEDLLFASENGRLEDVQYLISKGADANSESRKTGRTALMRAAENGHARVVEFLIQKGASINMKSKYSGKTALMRAAQFGQVKVVRLLLDHGADVNLRSSVSGKTALMRACVQRHHDVAELLLKRGAQVNTTDKHGKTALDYCVEADSMDLASLLLKWGGGSASQAEDASS